ncbi:MAG: endonuclease MutS2, partial [Eubacteriales bacterium]|nr:endonuclease MutS2 [Eubacteriales bacterium]
MGAYDHKRLEFDKVLSQLEAHCHYQSAKELARGLDVESDPHRLDVKLRETEAAMLCLQRFGSAPISAYNLVGTAIQRSMRESQLSIKELMQIASFLRSIENLQRYVDHDVESYLASGLVDDEIVDYEPYLRYFHQLQSFPNLYARIDRSIISEEEIADEASPRLAQIRRQIRDAQASIRNQLNSLIQRHADDLSDRLYTQRNGRFVLPLKADRRGAIKGFIHDSSSSGQTVFIEPLQVFETNNRLRELEGEEEEEIQAILMHLSAEVADYGDLLLSQLGIARDIDFIQAKARLAVDMKATRANINYQKQIVLEAARHPLIDPRLVVPIDIELGRSFKTLIITGPNTGGKTVALKTLGLLSLMGLSGLMIPAAAGSQIAYFEKILADIGDEQSIEQSLSTFSSHMKHLVEISKQDLSEALLLIDELGSGTDPSEGAALAEAILEDFRQSGAVCMASTHYRELKIYAMEQADVENACCEFDLETLLPSYRLLIGVPGVSNAFVISKKLGLSDAVIDAAEAKLNQDTRKFERLLFGLEQDRKRSEEAQASLESERKRLELAEADFE